jgi:sRNA-binding carbon storage regulator CsrA
MRYLNRKLGETLMVGKDAEIVILNVQGNNITLGVLDAQESHQKNLFQSINTEILVQSKYQMILAESSSR